MSIRALESWVDDRNLYPLHEEDDVPEIIRHELEVRNLRDVLSCRFPDRFVAGNACIYWIPGDFQQYYAPDAFVADGPAAEPDPRVYHIWQDSPILFVAEVESRSLTAAQKEHNFRICELVLCVPEFLEFDPEELRLVMWRLGPQGYEPVAPEANGRLRSRALELEFGIDEFDQLRAYEPGGAPLRFYAEAERDREAAERRAAEEARQRRAADARAAEEARQRQIADARAAEEAHQRQAADARAAELERELAELRAQLSRRATEGEGHGAAAQGTEEPE